MSNGYSSGRNDGLLADQMRCPKCGEIAVSDSVDVGVGLIVRGNFACACGWEIDGPEDFGLLDKSEVPFAPADAFDAE